MATVLVTGANRGIGLALVRRFAGRGDQVIAVCRQPSAELKLGHVRVESEVDVTSDDAVAKLAKKVGTGSLDLLVLNAGILRHDDLDDVKLEEVRDQIEVNAIAPLRLALALRPALRPGAKIAAITSRMGSIGDNGSGGSYGYRMSKAALNAAAVSLARDLRGDGVPVAILHPGYVKTEMTGQRGNLTADESAKLLIDRIDALTVETSGTFWHANGEVLPW
ncbi:MAG TPA: SDR family oxidoreductase [Polyangia bacterium]|nr:SDR family oxidoreductase [Polyangia bacterium]